MLSVNTYYSFFTTLSNPGESMKYRELREKPLHELSDSEFEYIVNQLLNARPIDNHDYHNRDYNNIF